jgi:hypothetical protein
MALLGSLRGYHLGAAFICHLVPRNPDDGEALIEKRFPEDIARE